VSWWWIGAGISVAIAAAALWWLWWWIVAGVGGAILAWVGWWLWSQLPKRQMRAITLKDEKDRADIEDNFRKTIGQALGGIAVLFGAAAAYYGTQQTLQENAAQAKRSLEAAAEQSRSSLEASDRQSQRNLESSTALLISQQVAKGFEQLGSDKKVLRLGGIYALEGVMNGSPQYHQPVLEALCAFIRDGTETHESDDPPVTDIQAALTVIGRRKDGAGGIDLGGAKIQKSVLFAANLDLAYLRGANLNGANLGRAKLRYATLTGANLGGAYLDSADLTDAYLERANLKGANLNEAHLTASVLIDANFSDADLGNSKLSSANLNGANLGGANLRNADFRGANLGGANLAGADLSDAKLSGANVTEAVLTGANPNDAYNIFQGQLDQACGKNANLPKGMTLKPCP